MEVIYSTHGVERMFEHVIPPSKVEAVLRAPDGVIHQSRDKIIAFKRFDERNDNAIAVVAVADTGVYEVITVMIEFEVPCQ